MQSQNRLLNDDLDPSSSNILSTESGIDRRQLQIGKVEPVSTFPISPRVSTIVADVLTIFHEYVHTENRESLGDCRELSQTV